MNKSTSYKQRCSNLPTPMDQIDATLIARLGGKCYTSRQHLSLLNFKKFDLIHSLMWADYPCGPPLLFPSLSIDCHGLTPKCGERRRCHLALPQRHSKSCLLNKRLELYEGQINRLYSLFARTQPDRLALNSQHSCHAMRE